MRYLVAGLFFWGLFVGAAHANPESSGIGRMCSRGAFGPVECIRDAHFIHDVCQSIEVQARRHGLDPAFLARLLWQESRFDRNALSHAYAMGIAQFIASTAEKRGLQDPFNPAEAIEYSAEYLGELTRRYGNPGLAALAYNGGEDRADGFLDGGGLKQETVDYVIIITGLRAEDWRDDPPETRDFRLDRDLAFRPACHELATGRRVTSLPDVYVSLGKNHRSLRPRIRPEPRLAKWGAQLAFGKSEDRAKSNFDRATRTCRRAVGKASPDIVFVANRVQGRPGYYMARLSSMDRAEAEEICSDARRQGCACAVYKNW